LKALVDWTSAKGALQRYRNGWGVACGLEVSCSHDPKYGSRVYAGPGYAVDACGRDIVVCEPIYLDIKCDLAFDPCCPEPKTTSPAPAPGTATAEMLGCISREDLRAFDLCLRFDEKLGGGQRAIARGDCRPLNDCQSTRITETGALEAKEVTEVCLDQPDVREQKYRRALQQFIEELNAHRSSARTLRDWLHGKLHTFCFVEDCLCQLAGKEQNQPTGQYDQWLYYAAQDWRNHYFRCNCESTTASQCGGDGVPLARVWVWNKEVEGCNVCKVVYVDSYPPYRRDLSADCRSTAAHCIDLSRYIWRDRDDVIRELGQAGFKNVPTEELLDPALPAYLDHLKQSPTSDLICAPEGGFALIWRRDLCQRSRVVGFKQT
jgi:hypothetical protein